MPNFQLHSKARYNTGRNNLPEAITTRNEANQLIQLFFNNNEKLLTYFNITITEQLRSIETFTGIKLYDSTLYRFRKGVYKVCSLSYLFYFSRFWKLPPQILFDPTFLPESIKHIISKPVTIGRKRIT